MNEWLWNTWEYVRQGGWVMIPMAAASLAMWAMILERLQAFARLGGRDIDAMDALKALDGGALPGDTDAGIRRRVLDGFMAARAGVANIDRSVLRHVTERARRSLQARLQAIAVLAAVAPLLGLLGTVLGMIQTFEVIALFGTSNAKAMAGGISVALVTTQTGLLVAIPGLFISGALMRRARRLQHNLEEFSLFLDRSLKRASEPAGAAPTLEARA